MSSDSKNSRSLAKGLLASCVSLAAVAALELLLNLAPGADRVYSSRTFLDRQGGLEEIERAVVEEMGDGGGDALGANRIYREDARTFWRLNAGVGVTGQNYLVPRAVREAMPFTMTINEAGFRGPRLARAKESGALRVIALGNSSTFGWGVDDDATYPSRLSAHLGKLFPGRAVEVMNAGIPGFSTFQGERLLRHEILPLAPDFLILSFGFNDSRPAASTDSAFAVGQARWVARLGHMLQRLQIYRQLERLIRGGGAADRISPGRAERTTQRVPAAEYEERLRRMVRACVAGGARPILLAMAIPPDYRDALARVAREAGLAALDTSSYLQQRLGEEDVRRRYEAQIRRHESLWRRAPGAWNDPAYADPIHPSRIGHDLIAEWIARVIESAAAPAGATDGGVGQ